MNNSQGPEYAPVMSTTPPLPRHPLEPLSSDEMRSPHRGPGQPKRVWMICLVFYQTVLFLGYAYAHLLVRASPRAQIGVHALLFAATPFTLPVLPGDAWKPTTKIVKARPRSLWKVMSPKPRVLITVSVQ